MKALKWIGLALVVLILILVVYGLMGSSHYELERSIAIDAPREVVHRYVNDLTRWPEWTPWQDMDPSIKTTYGDKTSGVGAFQEWQGDKDGGWLRITESDPQTGIAYDMAFIEDGRESRAKATMRYDASGMQTTVAWFMEGEINIPVLGTFLAPTISEAVAPMFDQGLAKLKKVVEAAPPIEMPAEEHPVEETLMEQG